LRTATTSCTCASTTAARCVRAGGAPDTCTRTQPRARARRDGRRCCAARSTRRRRRRSSSSSSTTSTR
jgi:hypothetical protein